MQIFKNPVYYHLTNDLVNVDSTSDFKKIIDYLLTFAGDVGVKTQKDGSVVVTYSETPLVATLKPSGKLNRQITLTCEQEDNVSVGLIKNIIKSINYRVFNPQTLSFLVNDPGILDLTTANVDQKLLAIFKMYNLDPIFQYRDSLLFFAIDKMGKIHLINRHLLEHLSAHPQKKAYTKDFSAAVAPDIGRFVALFDRGLIPLSFYKCLDNDVKVINLSDFDIYKLPRDIYIEKIKFLFDTEKQSFNQNSSEIIQVKKGSPLIKSLKVKKYLAIKIAQDVGYELKEKSLVPKLKVLVFLDS